MKYLKRYNESKNYTKELYENFLVENFGFSSSDVQDWIQDILELNILFLTNCHLNLKILI